MKRIDFDQLDINDYADDRTLAELKRQAAPLRALDEDATRHARQQRATLARRINRKAA